MKKRTLTSIIVCAVLIIIVFTACAVTTTVVGQNKDNYTKEELVELIADMQNIKTHAHSMAESARVLGWEEDDSLIQELKTKWNDADEKEKEYQILLNDILAKEKQAEEEAAAKWAVKAAEYPAATEIWLYMKNLGWNDYVCAGIMGNLMAEVGGQTLNIRYTLSSSGYYGMCQWSRQYCNIWGAGLETQCDYLRDTIKKEFDNFGFKYQKGFNYDSFLNMNDAQQAALAFAKCYERCASGSYTIRQKNALKAYEYFVNN